mmetsp:Transcript_31192/g.28375  ORF Transcript_31192/g.28375 Transcript_31192/m.28375 type:complete len:89 (+) Transcript_31192:145-411(+)
MQQSLTQSQLEVYDELNIRNKDEIRNFFEADEKILLSTMVKKINKNLVAQERMIVITNKAFYNIQPNQNLITNIAFFISPQTAIKRKI